MRGPGSPVICIYGAGSVGCLVGGLLSRAADMVLIGRPAIGTEIAAHGLHLTSWRGEDLRLSPDEIRYSLSGVAALRADLVLVTVKSGATEEVGHELAAVLRPQVPVISFQNGMRNTAILRKLLPGRIALAGMVPFNVVHRGEGVFHRASEGELMVEDHPSILPFLDAFMASGLPLRRRRDIEGVQWAKLLFNLNNAVNALSGLPLKDELAQRDYRRCLAMLQREALNALEAAHQHPARLTPLPARFLPAVLEAPDGIFGRLASRMLAIDPLACSSMADDLQAGRRTEIDEINGEVVRLAEGFGLHAPANSRIIALIRAAESGDKRRWDGAELLAELRQSAR